MLLAARFKQGLILLSLFLRIEALLHYFKYAWKVKHAMYMHDGFILFLAPIENEKLARTHVTRA
jgi:hypothetical protein